jgi:hypothetical protein
MAHAFAVGGAEEMVLNLVQHLPERFEPVVCCINQAGPIGEEIRKTGTPVAVLGLTPGLRHPWHVAGIRRYLRETKPAIVHTFLLTASLYGRLAAILERSRFELEELLSACERGHFIQFDGRRYTFAAPLIAQVIRAECMTKGERRTFERRAIDALRPRADLESRALRIDLLARDAPDQSTLDLAIALAQDAYQQGAKRMLVRILAAAQRIQRAAKLDPKPLAQLRAHFEGSFTS